MTSPSAESCNAIAKDRGRLKVCELNLRHDEQHREGDYEWPQTGVAEPKRFLTSQGEEKE